MEASISREQEAGYYLKSHRIMDLLNHLTSVLLFVRPALKTLGLCDADEDLKDDGHIINLNRFKEEVNKRNREIWSSFW
ncbi:EF-hand calcium-binding domain-containing protein 10 isoform X3 [Urocitellus parryii]|uniref:EF-hand calcium-binding domain-containing protein 10 isoform X3 n=1 Tax=Urocitellus parryii TaxID=9999 RepID=UPI000E5597E5|nr:EF-hand calcium-binding domain-containing protein 10 isoform X3 [Urocitellus parryii]